MSAHKHLQQVLHFHRRAVTKGEKKLFYLCLFSQQDLWQSPQVSLVVAASMALPNVKKQE